MKASNPIGVFDSGVGGLSVLSEIRRTLPAENLLYVADSANAPYGDKSQEFIEKRAIAITEFLLSQGAKAVVVACNTATGAAVSALRGRFPIPVVAMEPAIKPAAADTKSGVIGVLATQRTLASNNFVSLFERYGSNIEILAQACPGLVEQVEAGAISSPKTRSLLAHYVQPLLVRQADILVLGCTHYPFLRSVIQEISGPDVSVIDSAAAIARELKRRLTLADLLSAETQKGREQFWTSSRSDHGAQIIAKLWQSSVVVNRLPECAQPDALAETSEMMLALSNCELL